MMPIRRCTRILLGACLLGVVSLGPVLADTGRRVALVIGNSAYQHVGPLANPVNDATAIAQAFRDAGFTTVTPRTDLDLRAFNQALEDFEILARDADVAVLYYSGHGLELGGHNYLVPVDAAIEREVAVKDETVSLDRALEAVEGATKLKLVILDACRSDPFKATSRHKAVNRGLDRVEPSEPNELIAYAAKAGTVALDGEGVEGHSPYTAALLNRLTVPGLDVELALRRVHDDVLRDTHGEQEPFYYGAMGGDEMPLKAKPAEAVEAAKPQPVIVAPAPSPVPAPPPPQAAPPPDQQVAKLETAPDPSIAECDRLAASPSDQTRPAGIPGIEGFGQIDAAHAVPACRAALAARPDDPRIAFELGRALLKDQVPAEALTLFRKAAEAGHSGGMVGLGAIYANGMGLEKNPAESTRWLRKAAEAGNSLGMADLGTMYEDGRGVENDPAEAVRWYRKAAEAGNSLGMNNLGRMYAIGTGVGKDPAEAVRWYRKAAEAGNSLGMADLGTMYEDGTGVGKDPAEAVRWYRKAAEAGNSVAMSNLGVMYEDGRGVENDPAEAVRWYRKAAEAGNSLGMNNLGRMYANGRGVEKDPAEAARWFRRAAEAGESVAMNRLGEMYDSGTGVKKDPAEAVRWYLKAADAGNTQGMFGLGWMYEHGIGVEKDLTEAARWYRKSADLGNDDAKQNLARLGK